MLSSLIVTIALTAASVAGLLGSPGAPAKLEEAIPQYFGKGCNLEYVKLALTAAQLEEVRTACKRRFANGDLELWSQDMKEKVLSVEPIANRCVIFSTSMNSYHGYSQPLACPESITRRSIAMYYYNIPEVNGDKKITETYWQDLPDET